MHGDLDSLRDDVRAYYSAHGVEISQDPSQESTDFGKTMQKIAARVVSSSPVPVDSIENVIVLGTLGGRVDQAISILHNMLVEETNHANLRLWLFSEASISFILRRGRHVLRGLQSSELFTENVGLVPIYGRAVISTRGLEWDVKHWDTFIGGNVSSSNHVKADEVWVETNEPILFTVERAL